MPELVIATRNRKKCLELAALLRMPGVRWRSVAEFPGVPDVRETGRTFEANAVRKALAAARATGRPAVADDSGLEVDALSGAPGVRSARFSGRHGDDRANKAKLLRKLAEVAPARRGAQFRCVLALASPQRVLAKAEGTLRGQIAMRPRGRRGFGYDPVFLVPRFGKTVAELPAAVKNRISHRARAAARLRRMLPRALARYRIASSRRSN